MVENVSEKATTEDKLRDYEMVYIISPEVADDKLDAAIDNVSRFITERGGSVSQVERWGRRKLAYPIKHFAEGNYVLAHFKLKPASSKELEARLEISDDILRHLLIKLD
jgi:small subunit ribosomal protein S6